MLHACAVRFDVKENLEKFCELNKALEVNYAISFCFYLYLIFHACAIRFDVMRILKNF